ncbi:MAG: hypothetical protein LIO80_00990 [Lachnospiraceae bacterium]|nr:hypothetical protein [Lachnospiraceae bacterium]
MLTRWRKKHPHITLKAHMILFLGFFFAGVLLANLRWADESFWLGYQTENALQQIDVWNADRPVFLRFLLRNRLPIWVALCMCSRFFRGEPALLAFSGWLGLSLGILSATFARRFSVFSILLTGAMVIPQIFAYLPAYLSLIRNRQKRSAADALKYLMFSGVFLLGAAGEYYLNPWFLQKTYAVIQLLSHSTP